MDPNTPTRYWKSLEERDAASEARHDEFPEPFDGPVVLLDRRGFLKAAGFTMAAAALTGCGRAPVEKAIPYLIQPEEIIPGRSLYYASTCGACNAGCGVLVKTRDGRPIKIEGNREHPLSRGGLCAVGQASVLEFYDAQRLTGPVAGGKPANWDEVDRAILARLAGIRAAGGAVRFLSGTITSPATNALLEQFRGQFADRRDIVYDPLSSSAILDAHERTHGERVLPRYRFDLADVIAGFDADFLGTWISPVEFTARYRAGRALDAEPPRFSYHAQFESRMSLTGTKADRRASLAPGDLGLAITHLAFRVARLANTPWSAAGIEEPPVPPSLLDELAQRLWQHRGRSLVVCGVQDVQTQVVVNFINHLLGSYGSTLDLDRPSLQRQGSDRDLQAFLEELQAEKVSALFIHGNVNPAYGLPGSGAFAEAVKRVPLVVSLADRLDETSSLAHYVCPDHHFLESWSDAEPVRGVISLTQPAIHPLANTRPLLETLATWSGKPQKAYDALREIWKKNVFPRQKRELSFDAFWDRSLQDGFAELEKEPAPRKTFRVNAVRPILKAARPAPDTLALVLYPKVGMLDGRHAHNPWLQELPDPVTKVTWDNYACLSPAAAARLGLVEGDVIRLAVQETGADPSSLELPAYLQPGQHDGTIAVALGYGCKTTERFLHVGPKWLFSRPGVGQDGRVGKNVAPLLVLSGDGLQFAGREARLRKTGKKHLLACSQSHHTLTAPSNLPIVGGRQREIVRELTLPAFIELQAAKQRESASEERADLWPPDHRTPDHHWGLAIDLAACTGCSACVIACQAENNIPVVGKDEVQRHREMHWLRIDRYYSGEREIEVVHQPMLCQQCANAPCETVCPVLATVHSDEGLNQQIYNRCVGTRYCANNCPYKTRRFNWFDYNREDRLANLALNPDVTVRSRGVMEKCTFCIQRIQEAKIEAKGQGGLLADGDIQTACQQSCPARAILFGDLNDPKSRVSKARKDPRNYFVLGEFNFRPAVGYLAAVRNRYAGGKDEHHG